MGHTDHGALGIDRRTGRRLVDVVRSDFHCDVAAVVTGVGHLVTGLGLRRLRVRTRQAVSMRVVLRVARHLGESRVTALNLTLTFQHLLSAVLPAISAILSR